MNRTYRSLPKETTGIQITQEFIDEKYEEFKDQPTDKVAFYGIESNTTSVLKIDLASKALYFHSQRANIGDHLVISGGQCVLYKADQLSVDFELVED